MSWTTKALTCRQMWGINVCHLAPGLAADLWGGFCETLDVKCSSESRHSSAWIYWRSVCCLLFFFCSCDYITESDLPLWACSAVIHHMSARRTYKEWLTSRCHTSGIHHLYYWFVSACSRSAASSSLRTDLVSLQCRIPLYKNRFRPLGWTPSPEIRASGIE